MEWFCTDEEIAALHKREKYLTVTLWAMAAVSVAAFAGLCLAIRTENMNTMHPVLIAVTAVMGWGCILLYTLGVREVKTQRNHLQMLRDGDQKTKEGIITVTRRTVQIPKSIRIRKVLLDTGNEDPESLNLDESRVSRMPPDGSRVRLALSHSYIAGVETLEAGKAGNAPARPGRLRKAGKLLPLLGIWAIAALLFSSFVFYQITETDPGHKITIYMDGKTTGETALAARLEKMLPDPVRMVRIYPFRYAMFGSEALKSADLFIIPDSHLEQYREWLAPDTDGWIVRDPENGISVGEGVFLYSAEEEAPQVFRMYLGAASPHLADGMARRAAELMMSLDDEKEGTR